jgi:hypothetical protein
MDQRLFVPGDFDVAEYLYYDKHGDMHECVKGKLFAFRGPEDDGARSQGAAHGTLHASDYFQVSGAWGMRGVWEEKDDTSERYRVTYDA